MHISERKRGADVTDKKKKMGRPTDNPKLNSIHVRLDEESKEILDLYCKQEGLKKNEGIRRGIKMLRSEIK